MLRHFDNLHQIGLWVATCALHAVLLKLLLVCIVKLIAMAVALFN